MLRAAQSQPEHKLNLPLAETPINIGTHQDYVALVNLEKYYRFIVSEDGTLRKYIFEANVRDYQGHNAVNQDIQNTLVDSTGEDFWWLNNGITLLADEAILATSKELVLTEPAVVNGLQTSNEIYHFFQAHPEKTENLVSRNSDTCIFYIKVYFIFGFFNPVSHFDRTFGGEFQSIICKVDDNL